MRLIDHPGARAELLEAARFYERSSPVLGARFLEAVDRAIEAIKENPGRWRVIRADVRGCKLSRFPYTILYRVTATYLEIFAYKHDRRHPDYWQDRLTD